VITVSAALLGFDGNLMRAAANLGASPATAYRRIMFPLIMPSLAAAALFVFVTSFDEFIVASFLAGPEQYTLPLQMWSGVHDDVNPTILAAATLFVLTSVLLLGAMELLRRRGERLVGKR
jgi:putative spermidine/putrescine transport system permease protein